MTITRKRFRRNTHGADGQPLTGLELVTMRNVSRTWIVHLLEHDRGMRFSELCEAVWKYNKDFDEEAMKVQDIALGLVVLVEDGLATLEEC